MDEREEKYPKVDLMKNMNDACFLFRRVIMLNEKDKVMSSALSLFFLYMSLTVDFSLEAQQKKINLLKDQMED